MLYVIRKINFRECTFRQNDFNALTNCYACGLQALNTWSLLVLKHRNSCSRSEQAQRQFVWTEISFPIFICRSLRKNKTSMERQWGNLDISHMFFFLFFFFNLISWERIWTTRPSVFREPEHYLPNTKESKWCWTIKCNFNLQKIETV